MTGFRHLRAAALFLITLMLCSCATVITTVTDSGMEENRMRRSFGALVDDGNIVTMIKVNLNVADERMKKANITVVAYNGVVLIVGQIESQELKNLVTRVATSSSSRVKTVHNELEVSGVTSFLSRSNDVWISTKLKTLMLANGDVSGLHTKITTKNGVVYLMGLVTQRQSEIIVDLVSKTRGVVKVVRAFEYTN